MMRSALARRPYVWEGAWANRPAASAVASGDLILVTDIGTPGSIWFSNGTRWYPEGGTVNLYVLPVPVTGLNDTETVVAQALLRAGSWLVGDTIRIEMAVGRSGTTNNANARFRIGTAGTTADTLIASAAIISGTNKSYGKWLDVFQLTDTSARMDGAATMVTGSYGVNVNTAYDAGTAISSASGNNLYIDVDIYSAGTTDTVSLEHCVIQLMSKR